MKKLLPLLFFGLTAILNAQGPSELDPNFNVSGIPSNRFCMDNHTRAM